MITAGGEINDGGDKADKEKEERHHRRREVVVEDALDVAHGGLGGRDIHALVKSVAKQTEGECKPDPAEDLHHATPNANTNSLDHFCPRAGVAQR